MSSVVDSENLLAVVAHGLMDAAYPAFLAATTLQRSDLTIELQDELLEIIVSSTRAVCDTLHDLAQGLPAGASDRVGDAGLQPVPGG